MAIVTIVGEDNNGNLLTEPLKVEGKVEQVSKKEQESFCMKEVKQEPLSKEGANNG